MTAARLHETDYTPWEGYEAAAWPTLTLLRGKIMMENGEFKGDIRDGRLLKRRIAEEVRHRGALDRVRHRWRLDSLFSGERGFLGGVQQVLAGSCG